MIMKTILIFSLVLFNIQVLVQAGKPKTADDYMNMCVILPMEGASKTAPSPEPDLECPSFREKSCCNTNVTADFLENHVWGTVVNYVHCPEKPRLSPKCERLTHQEMCFFACSPNLGPWIAKPYKYPDINHLDQAPICASQCKKWWNACKEEYTCHKDWIADMDWNVPEINSCKEGSVCRKYKEFYSSATDFCNTIWHGAYKVVPDSEPCMVFAFDTSKPNPNTAVAQAAAEEKATA
ncbi:folate receptor gamma [Lingula anatina]|uniref:Folate receptor gamma n=1 Tax=Lingula anatina TaxID=7574 RepID=A0A1S3JEV8_LINAN|nr:folate receptor gamma [Lingula anatina]|eukprot:XP_013408681.1 folate receptor gamma [Lingula anatina]